MKITIIRSSRKTVGISVKPDGSVTVRAPKRIPKKELTELLKKKEPWIRKHIERFEREQKERQQERLTHLQLRELAQQAAAVIPGRVELFAKQIGVDYGRITIRNQKTRWGSCSGKGNLNFNCLLMLAPPEVLDYVVVHELCHRKEMNHSGAFWQEVEKILPDYKESVRWLKKEGIWLMQRMCAGNT